MINGHEAAPLINNGVMFVATPGSQVIALDAKTGSITGDHRRPPPEDVIVLHPTTRRRRGVRDKVFLAANECARRTGCAHGHRGVDHESGTARATT